MKTVRDACQLQPNALTLSVSDQIEKLEELIASEGDGKAFFEKTFITAGMRDLLRGGISRLAGKSNNAIFHLKQAMGGGKTHLLVGLGLAAKSKPVRASFLSDIPYANSFDGARIVAFNGRNDPSHYFWGEAADQLGKSEEFASYWKSGPRAPDESAWIALLKSDIPTLLLFDEMPPYFQHYGTQTIGTGTVADIITRAFANLLSAAGKLSNVCVVVSDLDAAYEQGGAMIQRALSDARKELQRQEKTITPVDLTGNEIYEILRKRLFKKLPDQAVIEDIAAKFGAALAEAAKSKTISRGAEALADEIANTYPFHPRLKDLIALFKENAQFKQTRGLMELISRLLKSVWNRETNDVFLIGAQHFDLSISDVREKLSDVSGMRAVISRDLWDAAHSANAQIVDANSGTFAASEVGVLLLTASLSTAVNAVKGLTRAEILECVTTPGQGIDDYVEALDALQEGSWYIHSDGTDRIYFDRQENLTKLLQSLGHNAPESKIDELIRHRLDALFDPKRKAAYTHVLALPQLTEVIAEVRHSRVLLIVDPDSRVPPEVVQRFFQSLTEKNNVLVLTGDKTHMANVTQAARRVYATMKADSRIPKTHAQREEYESKRDQYEQEFESTVLGVFDKLYFPVQIGNGQAELRSKPLDMKRDTQLAFKGEDQVINTLTAKPTKLHLSVTEDFDALRSKAEDLLWPDAQIVTRWADINDRAKQKSAMPWMPPGGLDDLRAEAIKRGLWEDLGNGSLSRSPAQKQTSAQINPEGDADDTGKIRLRITPINAGSAPRIHYAENGPVTLESPTLAGRELATSALRLQLLVVDPTGLFETGNPVSWVASLKIRARLTASAGIRSVQLFSTHNGRLRYSMDGREARNGVIYADAIQLPESEVTLLAFSEIDGVEAKQAFKYPAQGGSGPVIIRTKPAVLNSRKTLSSRTQTFLAVTLAKSRNVRFKGMSVSVGQGSDSVSFRASEVEIDADYFESVVNLLTRLLDATVPVSVDLKTVYFQTGQDLIDFCKALELSLTAEEVSQ